MTSDPAHADKGRADVARYLSGQGIVVIGNYCLVGFLRGRPTNHGAQVTLFNAPVETVSPPFSKNKTPVFSVIDVTSIYHKSRKK